MDTLHDHTKSIIFLNIKNSVVNTIHIILMIESLSE